MRFSQSKRESDIEARNFHPGPGHYEIIQHSDMFDVFGSKKVATAKNQRSSWGYGQRFNPKTMNNTSTNTIGPGEYTGISEWVKPVKKQKPISTFESEARKILTIPSIPSQGQNLGYQETSDGLLVIIQNPKTNVQGVIGPGSYEIKTDFLKPKIKGFSFAKSSGHPTTQKQETEQKPVEISSDLYSVNKLVSPLQTSQKEEEEAKSSKKNAKRKTQFPAASKRDSSIEHEKFEYPGPGHYYNEQIFTCFKTRSISPKHQAFNSKESRFANLFKVKEIPGPGEYDSEKAYKILTSKSPAHEFIGREKSSHLEEQDSPGPGSYEVKSIFKDNDLNENLIKQLIVDKPPAFGTSSKRFVKKTETILETPGPGYYDINSKKKKKSKKIIRFINPSVLPSEEEEQGALIQSIHGKEQADSGLTKLLYEPPKGHRPYYEGETPRLKANSGAISSFKSQTKRFLTSAGVNSLGPGYYEVPNENFKKASFNQQKNIISKGNRDSSFNNKDTETLGPGYYNPKADLIYPHKFSLKIPSDPKYEPKFSLLGY